MYDSMTTVTVGLDVHARSIRLAVVRAIDGSQQLEFPIGRAIYKTAGWLSSVRLSPSNDTIAFTLSFEQTLRDFANALRGPDGSAAVFLDDQWHVRGALFAECNAVSKGNEFEIQKTRKRIWT